MPSPLSVPTFLLLALIVPVCQAQDDEHRDSLFSGSVPVPAGKRYVSSFTTRTNYRHARIAGNVQAQGGSGNDIRVLVLKGQGIVYDSGRRRSVVLSVDCSEPGSYTLVFDNSFSVVSPKVVTGTISLVHWGVDTAQNALDAQANAMHYQQATAIVQRLYAALKADERSWGTTQLVGVPHLIFRPDPTVNAAASWMTNTIYVNRGLCTLADKAGEKGQDILAGSLAHELGHIFYRHPGYGSSGPSIKGLLDELQGVTALDRTQEKEADLFGMRLACQAGFDPQGRLLLMRLFAQQDRTADSFMKNHPSGIERYNYLLAEAARCTDFQQRTAPLRTTTDTGTTAASTPTPSDTAPTPAGALSSAAGSTGVLTWTLVQNPNSHWTFKITDSFLYGEHQYPQERRSLGDYDTVDVKKQGEAYVGTQRVRIRLRIRDSSPQGFHTKVCQWEYAVQLTSVTPERIEGRWEGYPPGSQVNPNTCERSGSRLWEDVTWIRE
jgi:hypothetical protein